MEEGGFQLEQEGWGGRLNGCIGTQDTRVP